MIAEDRQVVERISSEEVIRVHSPTVHFCSEPDIVQIPRRSLWRRKLKPFKDKCCSCFTAVFIFLCFPCIEVGRLCIVCYKSLRGTGTEQEVEPPMIDKNIRNIASLMTLPYIRQSNDSVQQIQPTENNVKGTQVI